MPVQDPPPEDISMASSTLRVLREAQSIQKNMVKASTLPSLEQVSQFLRSMTIILLKTI